MTQVIEEYYSCGKLLITGEYLILRGARGLALPTSRGQRTKVSTSDSDTLKWTARTDQGDIWFQSEFSLPSFEILSKDMSQESKKLAEILKIAKRLNPSFLEAGQGVEVECTLEFPREWGLGSSSTLVNNIARWAQVDCFELQLLALGGSGYDVKVAERRAPIIFSREGEKAIVDEVNFLPSFSDKIWFVHLGEKQDTESEVARFADIKVSEREIDHISRITDDLLISESLNDFERLLQEHDLLLSRILAIPAAKEVYPDFSGMLKYLGAWGGDFMLATGDEAAMDYFRSKGMNTILSFKDMIKQ